MFDSWRTSFTLVAVFSLMVFAAISATLLVFLLKNRKKQSTGSVYQLSGWSSIFNPTTACYGISRQPNSGMNPTEGLHLIYSSGQIILRYSFNPYYNSFEVACCRFDQSVCSHFVNNRGQVALLYRGRIFINNYNGEFEVIITHLSVMDAGKYICGVRVFPVTYEDVEVTVSDLKDLSGVNIAPLLPKSTIKPTVWPSASPSTNTDFEKVTKKLSDGWRPSYTLAAVLTVLVLAVISMTLLVYRLKTGKKRSTEKSGTCGSNSTVEQNSIIYCMVDFKPHQDPFELYANLQIHSPEDTDSYSRCTVTTEERVEYSTIMRAPA